MKFSGRPEPAPAAHDDRRLAQVELARPSAAIISVTDTRARRGIDRRLACSTLARARLLRRRDRAGPERHQRRRARSAASVTITLPVYTGCRTTTASPSQLEAGDVGREAHPERAPPRAAPGRGPAAEAGKNRRAVVARAHPRRRRRRERLRAVAREPRVLDDDDDVGTVAAELLAPWRRSRARRARARAPRRRPGVGRLARRRHRLERHLPQLPRRAIPRTRGSSPSEHLRFGPEQPHQLGHRVRALAHDAAGRCAPAAGPWTPTVSRTSPSCAGWTSSGFFFAAMMPLSEGSRGRAMPSSIVSTAGSGKDTISGRALELPPGRALPFAELEVGDCGDAGKTEQLRPSWDRRCRCAVSVAMRAEEDQVVAAVLELRRERGGDGRAVEGNLVRLELHRAGRRPWRAPSAGSPAPRRGRGDRDDLTGCRPSPSAGAPLRPRTRRSH